MKIAQRVSSAVAVCLLSVILFFAVPFKAYAYTAIKAEIPVDCLEIQDDNTHVYTIKIETENDSSPAPNSDTLEISESGTGHFEINITEPGTFIYKISEIAGDDTNIGYDSNIYYITLFVENITEDELAYTVSASIGGRDTKTEKIGFKNIVLGDNYSKTETTVVSTAVTNTATATETVTSASSQTTAVTTAAGSSNGNHFTGFIDSVLTGDSFPAHAIRIIMSLSVLTAISTFLFKRDNSEEED